MGLVGQTDSCLYNDRVPPPKRVGECAFVRWKRPPRVPEADSKSQVIGLKPQLAWRKRLDC